VVGWEAVVIRKEGGTTNYHVAKLGCEGIGVEIGVVGKNRLEERGARGEATSRRLLVKAIDSMTLSRHQSIQPSLTCCSLKILAGLRSS